MNKGRQCCAGYGADCKWMRERGQKKATRLSGWRKVTAFLVAAIQAAFCRCPCLLLEKSVMAGVRTRRGNDGLNEGRWRSSAVQYLYGASAPRRAARPSGRRRTPDSGTRSGARAPRSRSRSAASRCGTDGNASLFPLRSETSLNNGLLGAVAEWEPNPSCPSTRWGKA